MTLSQISQKALIFAGAVLLGSTTTIGIPMATAANGPYLQAELTKSVEASTKIIRGTAVKCSGTSCTAGKQSGSITHLCVGVAREFGTVSAFRAGSRSLDAKALNKCNSDKRVVAKFGQTAELAQK